MSDRYLKTLVARAFSLANGLEAEEQRTRDKAARKLLSRALQHATAAAVFATAAEKRLNERPIKTVEDDPRGLPTNADIISAFQGDEDGEE